MSENLIVPYDAANQCLTHVRGIAPLIPGFEYPPPEGMRNLFLGGSAVTLEFVEDLAVAMEASPLLTAAAGGPGVIAELRSELAYQLAMQAIAKELDLHARGVRFTLGKRRRKLNQAAMRIYNIAKGMNRPNEQAVFIPHMPGIQQSRRRGKSSPDPKTEEPVILSPDGTPARKQGGAS